MNTLDTQAVWDELLPKIDEALESIASYVRRVSAIDPIEPRSHSFDDGEHKASLTWKNGQNAESLLGLDIVLADANERGDSDGLNLILCIDYADGSSPVSYVQGNGTASVFVLDLEVLKERLEDIAINATEFGNMVSDHLHKHQRRQLACDRG